VLHGNEDNQKDEVRKDTQAASFTASLILLTLAALHKFHIASLDIKGAYLQSGPGKRYVFFGRPMNGPAHAVFFGNS
jgi:hypothetical protein